MSIRTRIAPSPTGYAHVGLLSRVLINYALAKRHKGQFVWRNEDTDRDRFIADALEFNMQWIKEYGLDWDEGPDKGGPYAPYSQSERLDLYKEAGDKLIENDYAYRCFCTKERLTEMRENQMKNKERTRYDGTCRRLSKEEIQTKLDNGEKFTVRLKVPTDRVIEFDDAITKNHITWKSDDIDDYIIIKSDGFPTYHLAVVVDDVGMKISHALRGPEWIATTPVHILIYEGLGIDKKDIPQIGHFSVILDPNTPGKKFSKRNSSFKANSLLVKGYLKEAVLNYLMLLGWAPSDNRELFTLQEFVEVFSLERMQKANPTWDNKKLDWFNGIYTRNLTIEEYTERFLEWVNKYAANTSDEELQFFLELDENGLKDFKENLKIFENVDKKILSEQLNLVQERTKNHFDTFNQLIFFYKYSSNIDWNIKQLKNVIDVKNNLVEEFVTVFENFDNVSTKWEHSQWEQAMRGIGEKYQKKHGDVFMILRVAIVGGPFSPPLFESLQLLGKEETISRLKRCLES